MRWKWIIPVCSMIGPGSVMLAQDWTVFNMDNAGFPSNTVHALVQDQDAIIWAATDWGLVRYDGNTWTVLQQANSGLPDNALRCLAVDSAGRLWIGTTNAGIAILDDGMWSMIDTGNSPFADNEISGITHDHRGWVWVASPHGLYCWTGAEWRRYDDTPSSYGGLQLFGPNSSAVAVRSDDLVTVATRNAGLTYITEEDLVYYTVANSNFPDNSANAVAIDDQGDRWLACPAGGLIRHAGPHVGGPWFQYSMFTTGLPDNTLTSIVIDDLDRKICGTETAGVLVFASPSTWYMLDEANSGLPDDHVRCVMFDADGSLWVGMNTGGVARYTGGNRVPEATDEDRLMVYPQPNDGSFFVQLAEGDGPVEWTFSDPAGRTVARGRSVTGGTVAIHTDRQAAGVYVLRVGSAGAWRSVPVMVAR